MFRNMKVMLFVVLVLAIAGGAFAFAAANTMDVSYGGYVSQDVSGYNITNVVYDLDDADPTQVNQIIFDIDPIAPNTKEAVTVKISTDSGTPNYSASTCVVTGEIGSKLATCTFAEPITMESIDTLDVVASSSMNPPDLP